jgi:hypothetical protein
MVKITINSRIFNKEQISAIKDFFQSEMYEKHVSSLNLDTLEEIVISSDFEIDIKKINSKYELSYNGFTNNEFAKAVGKTIHSKFEEDNLRQVVLLNDSLVMELFYQDNKNRPFHFIYHELCHVHDHVIQKALFSTESRYLISENMYNNTIYTEALSIWSEYITVRLSCRTLSAELITEVIYIQYLKELGD